MKTLDDAWRWYHDTRTNLQRLNRLARRYWKYLPWDGPLGRDDDFRLLESPAVLAETAFSLEFLDDLAVVVLFSVFEQTVRGHVHGEVATAATDIRHPALQDAAADTLRVIEVGSFARVMEPYKEGHADLVTVP